MVAPGRHARGCVASEPVFAGSRTACFNLLWEAGPLFGYACSSLSLSRQPTPQSSPPPRLKTRIWVLDTSGRLYIHAKHRGSFHHSSFLRGGAVLSAGGIVVKQGGGVIAFRGWGLVEKRQCGALQGLLGDWLCRELPGVSQIRHSQPPVLVLAAPWPLQRCALPRSVPYICEHPADAPAAFKALSLQPPPAASPLLAPAHPNPRPHRKAHS
jgi:hypothetical protein